MVRFVELSMLVRPVTVVKLIPVTVPPLAGVREMRLETLVPEEGVVAAFSVMLRPLTVLPAPALVFLKVKEAKAELLAVRAVSEMARELALVEELEMLRTAPEALA